MSHLDSGDIALTVKLAGCSLAESPGKDNWVDEAGGLPQYICEIARAIKRSGKSTSQAIAIAVSRCKKWAAGGDGVDADTRAKAIKAIAEWEKKKASSHVKATHVLEDFVTLANKPGDGQRNVASYKGVKKYNKPMGAPLGTGTGYKGRSAMAQLKQVIEYDDNAAEAALANWEMAHGYVTEANVGDQITVTSKSGKTVTYVKDGPAGWKSSLGAMRTDEHMIDLINHDLVAKWNFQEDPIKTAAAEKAKDDAMWAGLSLEQLQKMIDNYTKLIASGKYDSSNNAGIQKIVDGARAELIRRKVK